MSDKIYMIPGLGFDRRIFKKLKLKISQINYIEYIEPLKNEPLQDYASRLIDLNIEKSSPIILIGYSFGGIIAQEIAKQIEVEKIILISSIKSRDENPFHFKIIGSLGLHHFFNKKWTVKTFPWWATFHGYADTDSQQLFEKMISQHSDNYLQWALFELSNWRGVQLLNTPIIHIHGEKDKTFPMSLVSKSTKVKGGTHVMVYNKAEEVSRLINNALEN